MTFEKDKTTTQLNHLEPRAHEKNACVARVKCARCGVLCTSVSLREPGAQAVSRSQPRKPLSMNICQLKGKVGPLFHGQEIFQVRRDVNVMEPYHGKNTSALFKETART